MHSKIKKFIVITFVFSWLIWLPAVLKNFEIISYDISEKASLLIGALSPFLATVYLERKEKEQLKNILRRSFNPLIKWQWLLVCLTLPLILQWLSRLIYSIFENNLPESTILENYFMILPLFILMFLVGGGLNEEIGWRNYVLEYYLSKHNALKASIILSFWWILWHLPLFFMETTNQSLIPYWLFVLPVIPLSVMLTWVYNNTKGSIFAVALFHTIGNLAHEIFKVLPTTESQSLLGFTILGIIYILSAIIIISIYGYTNLKK
jgi:membrane protease YdiL (CAAX protease family)